MSEQDVFIGRDKELGMIEEMIFDPSGARHTLQFVAGGGVGKTWLLREVYQRYRNDPRVAILRIDYSESCAQTIPSLSLDLMTQLGHYLPKELLEEYNRRLSELLRPSDLDLDKDAIRKREDDVFKYGIALLAQVAKEKRIVVLSDTCEATNPRDQYINELASNFPNAVIILAGRPTASVVDRYLEYPSIYKGWIVHDVYTLEPFSLDEALDFFQQLMPAQISPELAEKIFLLADGKPVLIAMAGEWLRRNVALPEDIELPLTELRELSGKDAFRTYQRKFEFALVDQVRSLRKPIDWAVLCLAYLNRRYDPEILRVALEIDNRSEIDELVKELRTLAFVRKSARTEIGLLHDEAQRLIQEHAWKMMDPDGLLRRALAQKVVDGYYLPEIERLRLAMKQEQIRDLALDRLPTIPDDWRRQELQMECLDYQFRANLEKGWVYLDQLIMEASDYRVFVQIDSIMTAMYNIRLDDKELEQVDQVKFNVRMAQLLLLMHDYEQASALAQCALDAKDIMPADATWGLIVLSETTSNPVQRTNYLQTALERAHLAQDPSTEAKVLNNLGRTYRQMGLWREAEGSYRQVLQLLEEEQDRNQYASTLNNLAYVYLLAGNLTRADSMAERALRMRKELGNLYRLGFSYSTKGRIAEALGDYPRALQNHRMAVDLARAADDEEQASFFQINVAAAKRRAHDFKEARGLLEPALRQEKPAIRAFALHQAAKVGIEEAGVLKGRGAVLEEVAALYERAEEDARQALELTRKVGDDYQLAGVLLDIALIAMLKDQSENETCLAELRQILQDHDYILIRGRLAELTGDLTRLRDNGDMTAAFTHYLEACEILADFWPASFRQTFERVRSHFFDAAPKVQKQVCDMINERFAGVPPTSPLAGLLELCADEWAGD